MNTGPTIARIPDERLYHLARLYHDNPRIEAAGWNVGQFCALPAAQLSAVLFPPERQPAERLDSGGWLPLLPAQALAAAQIDRRIQVTSIRDEGIPPARCELISPTGRHAVELRDGRLLEPMTHSAGRRAYTRPWPRTLARRQAAGR